MGVLQYPRAWAGTPPPLGGQVQTGHPLAAGLVALYVFGEGVGFVWDSLGRRVAGTLAGAAAWSQDRHGRTVFLNAGASDGVSLGTLAQLGFPSGTDSTVLLGYHKTDNTARTAAAFGSDTGGSTDYYRVLLPFSDGTAYFDYGSNGGGAGNRVSVGGLTYGDDFWAFTTGNRGMEIWQNGVNRALNAATPSRTTSNDATAVLHIGAFAGIGADVVHAWYCAIYRRQLQPQEIQSAFAAPLQVLVPPARRVWARAAVAGSTVVQRRTAVLSGTRVGSRQAL